MQITCILHIAYAVPSAARLIYLLPHLLFLLNNFKMKQNDWRSNFGRGRKAFVGIHKKTSTFIVKGERCGIVWKTSVSLGFGSIGIGK